MPIEFRIDERLAGTAATSARKGERVAVFPRSLLGPQDVGLPCALDALQGCLFSKIPGLPLPPRIGDLIVVIDQDLSCKAFVDELSLRATIKVVRPIEKDEAVFLRDISAIEAVHLDVTVPEDAAVVVVRSFNWSRSLFFDFGPLHEEFGKRTYNLESALGQQMTLLYGLPTPGFKLSAGQTRLENMKRALDRLVDLLAEQCDDECAYQELLSSAPWMLGASYNALLRHRKMDDANVPDFTAVRAYDECHDIIELKQPFLTLFRRDGTFTAAFNDAWNQAERYLEFCQRQRSYLLDQKQLRFENPRCVLLIGNDLSVQQAAAIRAKESASRLITVMSYDQLYRNALHFFDVVVALGDRTYPSTKVDD